MQGLLDWSIINYVLGIVFLGMDIAFFEDFRGEDEKILIKKKTKFYLFFPLWGALFLPVMAIYLIGGRAVTLWRYYKIFENRYIKKTFIEMYKEYNKILEDKAPLEAKNKEGTLSDEEYEELYELRIKEISYKRSTCYLDL